ncbi:Ran-binding protein 10 [Trichinella nativa]|uniref:Ran-binding protein 10 n=1 Tax=Trichinella nativa TaxID=6335 RepID=A0A0V1LUV1_9BILA|nr:Ran-binding protein 10 [Trichinella nativa]
MMITKSSYLHELYPGVIEAGIPLPTHWNPKDKYQYLGLSLSNLRVHYKACFSAVNEFLNNKFLVEFHSGAGKTHKDAAAVRSNCPIPAACGLYYFEVKIINKGRDGYIGIGLSQSSVCLNRLPGWDKFSYGYHGDDGNSFCSSGSGSPYGPTFTTGDVIGCGVHLMKKTCFYTKNGRHLGAYLLLILELHSPIYRLVASASVQLALSYLSNFFQGELYPTVGLQTPGEVVEVNFGQQPFEYDIMEEIKQVRYEVFLNIRQTKLPKKKVEFMNSIISAFLVQEALAGTAKSFNSVTYQTNKEPQESVENRQRIRMLLLEGQVEVACEMIDRCYPELLSNNMQLAFELKVRQFIELFLSIDLAALGEDLHAGSFGSLPSLSSPNTPPHCSPSRDSPTPVVMKSPSRTPPSKMASPKGSPVREKSPAAAAPLSPFPDNAEECGNSEDSSRNGCEMDSCENGCVENGSGNAEPETVAEESTGKCSGNGAGIDDVYDDMEDFDGDQLEPEDFSDSEAEYAPDLFYRVEQLVVFGRKLNQFAMRMEDQQLMDEKNKQLLLSAFSLIAYSNVKSCPAAYLLKPEQREPLANAVNSAILEYLGHPQTSALQMLVSHARHLHEEMLKANLPGASIVDPMRMLEFKADAYRGHV